MKYKYFVTVLKKIFQVSLLYLSIYFPDALLLLLATLEHRYLYFLLATFLKVSRYLFQPPRMKTQSKRQNNAERERQPLRVSVQFVIQRKIPAAT